jgi:WD40 repeat protein
MMTQPPCIAWAEKLALRREDLSPNDCIALDDHVATCLACRQALADYHFLSAALKTLPPPVVRPLPRLILSDDLYNTRMDTTNDAGTGLPRTDQQHAWSPRKQPGIRIQWSAIIAACLLLTVLLSGSFMLRGLSKTLTAIVHPWGSTLLTYRQHTGFISSVAWSPDGKLIASGSWDRTVQVWNASTGEQIVKCDGPTDAHRAGHTDFVSKVAWSPDGRLIASASWDYSVQVWDAQTCQLITTYHGHHLAVSSLSWSPDGTQIASGSWDHTVQVWNVFDGKLKYVYTTGLTDVVNAVAWSPDGNFIAAGGGDSYAYVWDATNGHLRTRYYDGSYPVETLAWSPDSKWIASGGRDYMVHIWDASDGSRIIQTYSGHRKDVEALAWSPDGTMIVSGSFDHTAQVWDVKSGQTLLIYTGHSEDVVAVAWSPHDQKIASGSWDNTIRVWQAPPDH